CLGGVLSAKTRPPLVEFARENFWKRHDIGLVVVTEVKDRSITGMKIEDQYAGERGSLKAEGRSLVIIDESDVKADGADAPPDEGDAGPSYDVQMGDTLLVCQMHDNDLFVGVRVSTPVEKDALVRRVARIGAIRKAATEAALKDGAINPDAAVAKYSLTQLQ